VSLHKYTSRSVGPCPCSYGLCRYHDAILYRYIAVERGCALHATQVWIQSGLRESLSPQIAASKMQSWRSLSSTVACGSIRCGPASRCRYFVSYSTSTRCLSDTEKHGMAPCSIHLFGTGDPVSKITVRLRLPKFLDILHLTS
jgi:hypothetical protein